MSVLDVGDARTATPRLRQQLLHEAGVAGVVLDQQDVEGLRLLLGGRRHRLSDLGHPDGRRAVASQKSSIDRTTAKYSSRSSGFVMKQFACSS